MLGFCRSTKTVYSAKHRSLRMTLTSFTPGKEHLNPVFNNLMLFVKENITTS